MFGGRIFSKAGVQGHRPLFVQITHSRRKIGEWIRRSNYSEPIAKGWDEEINLPYFKIIGKFSCFFEINSRNFWIDCH